MLAYYKHFFHFERGLNCGARLEGTRTTLLPCSSPHHFPPA